MGLAQSYPRIQVYSERGRSSRISTTPSCCVTHGNRLILLLLARPFFEDGISEQKPMSGSVIARSSLFFEI